MTSSPARNSIELPTLTASRRSVQDVSATGLGQDGNNPGVPEAGIVAQQLELADGGSAAWKVLCAAFVFEALLWGFPISFGIFENYYWTLPEFAGNSNIPLIGTISQGLCYLGAPFSAAVAKRYPRYQRLMIWMGWLLCIVGLVAGSFADTIGVLIATQGIMYGIGFVSLYFPIVIMVNEWWIARRGMAFGIIVSASGASSAVVPFAVEALLDKYGYKTTLRAVAVAITVLTGPLIPLFRNRLPPAEQSAMAKTSWSVFKKPLFWIYCVSTVLQGLGFFFPSLFLPSYASSIGLDATQGALLLAVMAFAQVLGQFVFGYLSDNRVSINLLAGVSSVTAAIASVAIWGRAKSLAGLIVFGLVYGIFGYGYASTRVGMVNAVIDDPAAAPTTFSIFIFSQGVGNVMAGPISAGLLSPSTRRESYGILRYKAVVIFSGACMFLSALTIGSWFLGPGRRRVV